MEVISRRLKAL